ncbi:MAG: histidine kinase, partial [Solirubrobacteraceae bacterium]|nr:histidine kinase [Solirubrobacteraceae bacterium]
MTATFEPGARRVVGRDGDRGLVGASETAADLVPEEEIGLIRAHDEARARGRYGGPVSALSGIVARIRASPPWVDLTLASALTIAGLLEVLLGGAADGSRLASALAIPLVTLPLALRRRHPLLPAAAIAVALLAQGAFDGFLIGHAVTPLVALVVALYSAGRHVAGTRGLAGAAALVAALVATRVAFDPSVERVADAALTLLYVPLPLLVGRWARGQVELRHGLEAKIEQLERERVRGARQAAEDERVRITSDLQELVAGGLGEIVERAQALSGSLRGGDRAHAPATFASIAATARDVLDDVRRVLGILRREDEAAPLAPPLVGTDDAHTSARQSDPGARIAGDPPAGRATRPDPSPPIAGDALGDGAARAHLSPPIAGSTPRRAAIGPDRASPRPAAPLRPGALQRLPRWPRALAGDGRRIDRLLVAALLAGAEIELAIQAPDDLRLPAALTAIAITAPLLGRRRQPVLVFAAVLGAVAVQSAVLDLDAFPAFDIAALVCATYAIGAHADRRAAIGGLVLAALGAATHAAVFYPAGIVPALLGGVTLPWIVGRTVRGHRRLTAEAAEKAARDEQARAQEARAATTAERMRVARELHDAVAHSISVIAIQAAGAEPLVARDPERAARCAELIAQVGREALVEL